MTVHYKEVTSITSEVREFVVTGVKRNPITVEIAWHETAHLLNYEESRAFLERKLGAAGADTRFGRIEVNSTVDPMVFTATWWP